MVSGPFEDTLVSNAQNGEDIRLMRVLRDRRRGFYVEIGASDPAQDSISKTFYDYGWHGIIVEPIEELAEAFRQTRVRDKVFQAVCSSRPGKVPFFKVEVPGVGTGMSTTDPKIADEQAAAGYIVTEKRVQSLSCDQILEGVERVDFMVIDVEGAEVEVIESLLQTEVRPDILVVEAIYPGTQEPSHHQWELLLLEAGYEYSAFDGINRFYVSPAAAELKEELAIPPNVTENYILATAAARLIAEAAERAKLDSELTELKNEVSHLQLLADFATAESRALRLREHEMRAEAAALSHQARRLQKRNERLGRELSSLRSSKPVRLASKVRRTLAPIRKRSKA